MIDASGKSKAFQAALKALEKAQSAATRAKQVIDWSEEQKKVTNEEWTSWVKEFTKLSPSSGDENNSIVLDSSGQVTNLEISDIPKPRTIVLSDPQGKIGAGWLPGITGEIVLSGARLRFFNGILMEVLTNEQGAGKNSNRGGQQCHS